MNLDFDEQPVGQHKKLEIPELPPEEPIELECLPLSEQFISKNHKIRFAASCKLVKEVAESNSEIDYSIIEKLLADSHPSVREHALEAFLILLKKNCLDLVNKEVIKSIMEKYLTSNKQTTKSKAIECLLILAALPFTRLYDHIKAYINKSSPKLVAVVLNLLKQLLAIYGDEKFPVKEILPQIIIHTKAKNITVKTEAMEYLKEAQKWNKEEISELLHQLKTSQQEELKEEFLKIIDSPTNKHNKDLEVNEIISPRNNSNIDEKWCNDINQLKKWNDKRDKLQELIDNFNSKKITNITILTDTLRPLLNDSNIIVVNLTIKIIGQLAKTFKEDLALFSKQIFIPILNKCKDKKTITEAEKCLEYLALSFKLEDIFEDIKESLNDKSSQVKIALIHWLTSVIFPKAKPKLIKQWVRDLTPIISKLTDDAIAEVRDVALSCLGTFKKHHTDPLLDNAIKEMNTQKREKIKKAFSTLNATKAMSGAKRCRTNSDIQAVTAVETDVKEVVLENVGELVELEIAAKIVNEVIPKEILKNFGVGNQMERQKQFQDLKNWVATTTLNLALTEALAVWIKHQTKGFKEKSHNIMKEAIQVLELIATNTEPTKKFALTIIPGLIENSLEPKLADVIQSLIFSITDSVSFNYVGALIIKSAHTLISVNSIKMVLSILTKMIDEYTIKLAPVEVVLDYARSVVENSNGEVRKASMKMMEVVYGQLGKGSERLILEDIKEVTSKVIEKQLDSTLVQSKMLTRKLRGEAAIEAEEKLKVKDSLEKIIPRVNIASQITSSILFSLADPSMKLRQEAKNTIAKILSNANHRILPTGLSPLIVALKSRMSEPCKNLAKEFISLVGDLIIATGQSFKQYYKIILQPLMHNLADKQQAIRNETLIVLDKFSEVCGPELAINSMGPLLEKDNPDLRSELLKWINKKDLSKADTNLLISPLIIIMQDRSKEIRTLGEEVLGQVIQHTGYQSFVEALQDLKPVVKSSLLEIIKKFQPIKVEEQGREQGQLVKIFVREDSNEPIIRHAENSSDIEFDVYLTERDKEQVGIDDVKGEKVQKAAKKRLGSPAKLKEIVAKKYNTSNKKTLNLPTTLRSETQSTSSLMRSPQQKEDTQTPKCASICDSFNKSQLSTYTDLLGTSMVQTAIIEPIGNKEKRSEQDKKAKWPINEIIPSNITKLKKALRPAIHPLVFDQMFSNNFKQIKQAITSLKESIDYDFSLMIGILDLLFKWLTTQMICKSNMSVNKEIIEFLLSIFKEAKETQYTLMDFEAASILPILCERLGHLSLKNEYKTLIELTYDIYNVGKVCGYLVEALESKNPRTKYESLLMINELVKVHGVKIIPIKEVKVLVRVLNCNVIKIGIIDLLYEIYAEKGEKIWGLIGSISEVNKEILKQSFKSPKAIALSPTKKTKLDSLTSRSIDINNIEVNTRRYSITQCIELIKTGNIQVKLDAIITLQKEITKLLNEDKEILINYSESIFNMFISILKETFKESDDEEYVQFRKYTLNLLTKICSLKFFVIELKKETLFSITEELLMKLFQKSLEEIEESEYMIKPLNLSVVGLIENTNPTRMFGVLFEIFQRYKELKGTKLNRLPNSTIKCLLKLCKTSIQDLDIPQVLIIIHEYLLDNFSNTKPRSHNDELGIRISKTVISELVKSKGQAIWEYYNGSIAKHTKSDLHIKRWISIVLKDVNDVLPNIIKGLTSKDISDNSIKDLAEYLKANPSIDIDKYLVDHSVPFSNTVLKTLHEYMDETKVNSSKSIKIREVQTPKGEIKQFNFFHEHKDIKERQRSVKSKKHSQKDNRQSIRDLSRNKI